MPKLTIKSNYQKREILYWHELTVKEQDFYSHCGDYAKSAYRFVRYLDNCYLIDDFEAIVGQNNPLEGWDGYKAETYFSGVCVKLCKDGDFVIMGRYYS